MEYDGGHSSIASRLFTVVQNVRPTGQKRPVIRIAGRWLGNSWIMERGKRPFRYAQQCKDCQLRRESLFWLSEKPSAPLCALCSENCAIFVFAISLMGRLKMQDRKMRHQTARVENAGLENAGPICNGGKCGTGKCGTNMQGWKMQDNEYGKLVCE